MLEAIRTDGDMTFRHTVQTFFLKDLGRPIPPFGWHAECQGSGRDKCIQEGKVRVFYISLQRIPGPAAYERANFRLALR